jgi:Trypsin-co-occurring domain 1
MTEVVRYFSGSDDVEVGFEIDPPEGYQPVGMAEAAVRVRDAVQQAVDAARDVLYRLKELHPDEVEVRFAIREVPRSPRRGHRTHQPATARESRL